MWCGAEWRLDWLKIPRALCEQQELHSHTRLSRSSNQTAAALKASGRLVYYPGTCVREARLTVININCTIYHTAKMLPPFAAAAAALMTAAEGADFPEKTVVRGSKRLHSMVVNYQILGVESGMHSSVSFCRSCEV